MKLQKKAFDLNASALPERGFYSEADISAIVRKAVEEVLLTLMADDNEMDDKSGAPSSFGSGQKLTLSVQEAADLLGISKPKMFELLRDEEIPYKRFGKKILISYQVLVDWINQS